MTFTQWLKRQQRRDDRIGDLARDVRLDPHWPPCRTLAGFQRYLNEIPACAGAVESLALAWQEWEAAR